MATRPQVKTFVRTVFGIVEMTLFTGVVFGWANMVLILKEENFFKDLCADRSGNKSAVAQHEESNDETDKCVEQDERLALIFTISVFAFNVAGFIGGSLQDKFGIRVVRLVACLLFLLAGVFALLLKKETANLMFPLVICLACGGMFVAITNYQIAVLHRKYKFLVSSSFSGALDSSSVVFLIFKTAYDKGAELRWIVLTYAIIAIVCVCFSTFFLLPKTSLVEEQEDSITAKSAVELGVSNEAVTPDTAEDQQMTIKSDVDVTNGNDFNDISKQPETTENGKPNGTKSNPDLSPPKEEDEYSSGWRYILTAKYLWLLYFFCLVQLRLWFFVGSLNSYLIYYTDDDKDLIETYSESFGLVQFFGFVFAPFTGLIMDLKPRNVTNVYFGPTLSFIITLLLCFLLGALVLIPVIEVQYLAFVVQVAMRAFLYASLISFILRAFPIEHYGKLYGVCTLIGATVSLLQYPAIILIDGPGNGNPYWINFGFFMLTFTAMGFPIYLWLSNRNNEETTTF